MNLKSDSIQLDSSVSTNKSRVRSMVNQLNAAVTASRPDTSSITAIKRMAMPLSSNNGRRPISVESNINSTSPTNKIAITSSNRPALQRAMTINNSPMAPSPPSTPNNNLSATYKRK